MKKSIEHWWNDNPYGGKLKYLKKNLFQCDFFHHKSHVDRPGIEYRHLS
jgi:hypothetical protein